MGGAGGGGYGSMHRPMTPYEDYGRASAMRSYAPPTRASMFHPYSSPIGPQMPSYSSPYKYVVAFV